MNNLAYDTPNAISHRSPGPKISSRVLRQVYVWGRRHQYVNLSFLGIFNFTAPYLPWVLLAFSVVLGSSPVVDLLGMVAGEHLMLWTLVLPRLATLLRGSPAALAPPAQPRGRHLAVGWSYGHSAICDLSAADLDHVVAHEAGNAAITCFIDLAVGGRLRAAAVLLQTRKPACVTAHEAMRLGYATSITMHMSHRLLMAAPAGRHMKCLQQ